jgi:hypothetical protein
MAVESQSCLGLPDVAYCRNQVIFECGGVRIVRLPSWNIKLRTKPRLGLGLGLVVGLGLGLVVGLALGSGLEGWGGEEVWVDEDTKARVKGLKVWVRVRGSKG